MMIPHDEIKLEQKKMPIEPSADGERKSNVRAFKPVIDMKKCTKCLACVAFCPENTIKVQNNGPLIDYSSCTGCLVCLRECPYSAIIEERE